MTQFDFYGFWQSVAAQDVTALHRCFARDAVIRWHCTNECFTAAEYIRANCEYPGSWQAALKRLEQCGHTAVTAAHVWGDIGSFHVTSFITFTNSLIQTLDEYWGDDGPAPQWRQTLRIGKPINPAVVL